MRFNLASLDPASPLAARIRSAIARDDAVKASNLAVERDEAPSRCQPLKSSRSRSASFSESGIGMWRSEADLHTAIVQTLTPELKPGVIAAHVPNGGKRGKAEAGRLKSMGTLAGMPDLLVICDGRVFGLEIKMEAGRLSREQKAMADRFRRAGCEYEVARSIAGARQWLVKWGAIEGNQSEAAGC